MYNTYILYVYLCVCVCMCVYVICRPIAIVSTDIFLRELLYTFFLQKPNPPPTLLRFFQRVQFAIWFFPLA